MSEPLVSVLITCYNREKFLAESIESVLASTYKNFELIIVDDCSTDNSAVIAKTYEKIDDRIKVYINEQNLTQFPNRNKAASYAKGKYIKYVDSDDLIFSWTLTYCVSLMQKYPKAGMGIQYLKNEITDEYLSAKAAIQKSFFKSTFLNAAPMAIILRTDFFKDHGYFNTGYGVPSDMYFNYTMASSYPVVLLKKEFFYYRKHEGQELNNRFSYVCYNYKFMQDALKFPNFPVNKAQKKFLLHRAEYYYVKDFLVYLKKNKNLKKAWKAYSVSGMNLFKMVKGGVNLSLVKLGLRKFKLPTIEI